MRVVKSLLQRCADVVTLMADTPGPCRLSAIAARLDLPKSATHRLLRELCELGWMEQQGDDGPYALTLHFALLGHRVLHSSRLPDLVQPVLEGLAKQTRELVRLTIATEDRLVWVAAAQGAPPGLLYQPAMDDAVVLHATANGKAFLATLDDTAALRLARRTGLGSVRPTPQTIDTPDRLTAELAEVRRRGYAVADGEAEAGITAVAVAVRADDRGRFGTMSVAGPSLRIPPDRVPGLAEALTQTARTLAGLWPATAITRSGRTPS